MDLKVLEVQKWLNLTYGNHPVNITVQMYPCSEGTDTGNPVL